VQISEEQSPQQLSSEAFKPDEMVASMAESLAALAREAASCRGCALAKTRKKVVFGSGSARSGIVFIGEAPGANEDSEGIPFIGRSGQLLDKELATAGIGRDDVYICNVVKCRPPANRNPQPEEVVACAHFLNAQLAILKPHVICALGLHATRRLIPSSMPMASLRGCAMDYNGIPVIATYHPAALLRNPRLKPLAQEDFRLLRAILEEKAPKISYTRIT
jgi:DNA polymerase